MTSYLIISLQPELLFKKTEELCAEKKISPFDMTWFDLTTAESKSGTKKSWGIEDIKQMQKKVFLKPMQGSWKAIIVKDADLLTTEAQNAMLKILEEPPEYTLFILTAASDQAFLPTVLSRCTLIRLATPITSSQAMLEQYISEIETLVRGNSGERLKKAEIVSKSKEEAISWIRSCMIALHASLSQEKSRTYLKRLKLFHDYYKTIKNTNTNTRLSLESLFLRLE